MEDKKRIEYLVKTINHHNYNYYTLDNPTISDYEWDKLYDELVELENKTGYILDSSPTQRVGGDTIKGFEKHDHKFPLYSLNKVTNFEQLNQWVKNTVKKSVTNPEYVVEYKYDGLTISLIYNNGKLQKAATRGNGFIGEDVTEQVKTIKTVPINIEYKGELIVQGEGIMKLSKLEKYNKNASEPLKNARNAVAGGIRNLNPKVTAKRNLDVIVYDITYIDDTSIDTKEKELNFLRKNKFYVSDDRIISSDIQKVEEFITEKEKQIKKIDVLTDGIVIKLNKKSHREELGYTSKFPKFAIAYKFPAQEVTTKLNNITWQVGRTGKITPIANLEPVELAGAVIKRATLNNYDDIKRKNIYENSFVFIRRSNEVIPEILGLARKTKDSKKIKRKKRCPSCNSELVLSGPNLFCVNVYQCKAQIKERIIHFASRDAMNIEGLSSKTIDKLFENDKVKSISDLYILKKEELLEIEGFKDKKAQNLIDSIEKSKKRELYRFIYALGINGVGLKSSKDLAKKFKTFNNFLNAEKQDILNMYDLGEKTAQNILDFFNNPTSEWLLTDLKHVGIEIQEIDSSDDIEQVFENKKFVITGSFSDKTRPELTDIIEKRGGTVTSSVSKNTDILLAGEKPGTKYSKAKDLGIKIIDEKDFFKII